MGKRYMDIYGFTYYPTHKKKKKVKETNERLDSSYYYYYYFLDKNLRQQFKRLFF